MNKNLLSDLENYWIDYRRQDLDFIDFVDENPLMFTYGSTPFDTFEKVIQETKKPKRFIVLGSTIGWQCFFWNSLFPDIPVFGYEIHDLRFDYSCYLAEKYNIENVFLFNDSLINAEVEDGDLIWQNNLCIPEQTIDEFNWKVLTRNENLQIVSYLPILQEYQNGEDICLINEKNQLKVLKTKIVNYPVSWTKKQSFYII